MEAPHIDIRGVKYFKDLNNKLNIRKQEANNTHPIHYIPFNLDSYNNITQQISSNNIFPDQYLLPQNEVEEIEINSLFSWKSKGDLLQVSSSVIGKVAAAIASAAAVAYVDQSAAAGTPGGSTYINVDPGFGEHVNNLRGTMFYVCQGSCLCGTVNNRGKVIYCYGDLVPRHGELFAEGEGGSGTTTSKDLLAAQLGIWTFGIFALLIVLILIRKSITSLRKHLQKVTERLPLYHDDDASSLAPSATSPSISGNKTPAPGDKPADPSMAAPPPELFSDDGTLTPDPDDPLAEEPPLQLGGTRIGPLAQKAGPVSKLKTVRIGRKDFKKGGEALRGKNVTEAFRVKEKDVKRTMKCHLPNIDFNLSPSSSSIFTNVNSSNTGNMAEVNSPEIGKKHKHYQKRTRIKSIVTPRRMKRGKSEEPFLDHDGNIAYSSDSEDNKLVEKDVVDAAAKAQEEQEIYNKIMERRSEWNRNRRGTDDCQVSCRFPSSTGSPYVDRNEMCDEGMSSSDDILQSSSSKGYTKMLKISRAPLDKKGYIKPYPPTVQGEEDLVLTVVKFERDRKPKSAADGLTEVSKV